MSQPTVVALNEQDQPVELERWRELAHNALVHEGVADGELNLLFVDEAAMGELNHEHMGESGPTDVLSFPIDAGDPPGSEGPGERFLGDVVVCPTYAAGQASRHGAGSSHDGTVTDEIALLVVHGVLHVLGHDHAEPDDAATMRARERALLDAYHRPR